MRKGTKNKRPRGTGSLNQTQGKGKEKELRRKKKAEKDTLISEVQILSPVRFNIPFNYLTVHLCKHPHPLLPERETHTHTQDAQNRIKFFLSFSCNLLTLSDGRYINFIHYGFAQVCL